MPKALKLSLLAISVLLIVFVFLGGFLPGGVRAGSDATAYQQMEVYSEVLQYIQNDYVVAPNIPDVTNGALHGLPAISPRTSTSNIKHAKAKAKLKSASISPNAMAMRLSYP